MRFPSSVSRLESTVAGPWRATDTAGRQVIARRHRLTRRCPGSLIAVGRCAAVEGAAAHRPGACLIVSPTPRRRAFSTLWGLLVVAVLLGVNLTPAPAYVSRWRLVLVDDRGTPSRGRNLRRRVAPDGVTSGGIVRPPQASTGAVRGGLERPGATSS
ncbi:hypothetical protein GCM10023203_33950 [Actinomycetospora straminea]|uniref:Uncharacterized protein n=1 Tax=Actinomycetospora straminea TaxID=663607 RepID=A0ABP9ESX9_9PSEU